MIDLDELIEYWQERQLEHPPLPSIAWPEAIEATVTYLEQFKDTQIMLTDLASKQPTVSKGGHTVPLRLEDLSFPGEDKNP